MFGCQTLYQSTTALAANTGCCSNGSSKSNVLVPRHLPFWCSLGNSKAKAAMGSRFGGALILPQWLLKMEAIGLLVSMVNLCLDLKDMTFHVYSDGLVTVKSPDDKFKLWLNFVLVPLVCISYDLNSLTSSDFILNVLRCYSPISIV